MTTEALMTPDPVTCLATDSINDAVRKMWEHDVGALPVVDEDAQLVGMITDRDATMAAYTQGLPLAAMQVQSAMATRVVAATARSSLEDVVALMQRHQVRRIPVVDGARRLRGIISLHDLAARSADAKSAEISEHVIAATLRAVCTPRALPVLRERAAVAVA